MSEKPRYHYRRLRSVAEENADMSQAERQRFEYLEINGVPLPDNVIPLPERVEPDDLIA